MTFILRVITPEIITDLFPFLMRWWLFIDWLYYY